jgi:hypothetical protein
MRFITGDFASWTVHFVNIYVKNQQNNNYLFSLLIMYGSSYMFQQNNAILRERLCSFLRHFMVNMVEDKSEYNKIIQ